MNRAPLRWLVLALALTCGGAGCGSTRLVSQWGNPEYPAPRFDRILVIGVSRQASLRRTFEDEFVARLEAAGVNAVPSYRHIPEDGPVDEARLREAVQQAGADAAIITRLVRVDTETRVSPGAYYPPPAFGFGFYDWYSTAWSGYYGPPRVYQYEVYTFETSLYDMRTNHLVWTGTVRAREPRDIDREIRRYVRTVVKALRDNHILAAERSAAARDA